MSIPVMLPQERTTEGTRDVETVTFLMAVLNHLVGERAMLAVDADRPCDAWDITSVA